MKRATALVALALAFCFCNKGLLVAAQPHAGVSPGALDFGQTPILFPVSRNLGASNGGRVALHVSNARIEGTEAAAFAVDPSPFTVGAGATVTLAVLFIPPAQGDFAATLRLDTDDPNQPTFAVPLTGAGTIAGAIAVRPGVLDFGRVGEGQTAARELIVASVGQADLYLDSLGFAPGTPSGFALVGSRAPATIAAGSSLTLGVRYSPAQGAASGPGALRLRSSDPLQQTLDVPMMSSINRAPLPLAQGRTQGSPLVRGELDTAIGATVTLDGSGSTDPDGDLPLTYLWTLATRPPGSAAAIGDAAAVTTSLKLDAAGSYSVLLQATDAQGVPSVAPSRLDLRALPPEELLVELVWDKVPPDLDLHFLQLAAERGSGDDCNWTNPDPASFGNGSDGNPHHLGDALTGYGPEQVIWKLPVDGDYRIDVVYRADHGAKDPSTNASVRVFAFGQQVAELHHAFTQAGEAWTAGVVHWPSATVGATP